jgi:hypothetical protein
MPERPKEGMCSPVEAKRENSAEFLILTPCNGRTATALGVWACFKQNLMLLPPAEADFTHLPIIAEDGQLCKTKIRLFEEKT